MFISECLRLGTLFHLSEADNKPDTPDRSSRSALPLDLEVSRDTAGPRAIDLRVDMIMFFH